jgi:hypothetical protein
VYEVMKIQMKKAENQGIQLFAEFKGIAADASMASSELQSPIIMSDEDRVKQVLLGL